MRRMVLTFMFVVGALFLAGQSSAEEMKVTGTQQALMGTNGVVTCPADFFLGVVQGDDRFDLPGFTSVAPAEFVFDRVVGLGTGLFTTVHRLGAGLVDMPLAVFPMTNVSPDPRFNVVPGSPAATEPPEGFPE